MEQRLSLIEKTSNTQYAEGSPLLLEACALYLDNVEKQCIAQLKWKNIGDQPVDAVLVDLVCLDAFGHVVKTQNYQYDRLATDKGQFFGGKTAIPLAHDKISKYTIALKAVSYVNGTIQEYATPLSYAQLPEEKAHELTGDLLAQYKRDLAQQGIKTTVLVNHQSASGLWQCVCKSWQMDGEPCCVCGADLEKLVAAASPALLEENLTAYQEKVETERKDHIYEHAQRSMETNKEAAYKEALALLESIPGWKDADELIPVCQHKIQELKAKAEADRLARERAAEQARIKAEAEAKKRKQRNTILAVLAVAAVAVFLLVTKVIIPNQKYVAAIELMNEDKYPEAYEAFVSLNGHRDSAAMATVAYQQYKMPELKKASVGSYITFGTYEQDNNTSNSKEDIEWLVLAKENNRLLVISRYALDCHKEYYTSVTWETCTLRKWLNNDFLNAAFSSTEKNMIPTVTVSADKNPYSSTSPGNATQDKVFLLSIPEVNKYFASDSARQCKPTAYAKKQGVLTSFSGFCLWWLRSPGVNQYHAACVDRDGGVLEGGDRVGNAYAVRPALWISLEPQYR